MAVASAVLVLAIDAWGSCIGGASRRIVTPIVGVGVAPLRLDAGAPPTSPTRPGASAPSGGGEDHEAPPGCD